MSTCDLSVIIPAYMEEENLRFVLPRLKAILTEMKIDSEINVVDVVKSMDNSKSVCDANGANYLNRENGNYYGDAVRTGIRRAQGKHIIFMDADGSHTPEFIPQLLKYKDDFDIVIASRYIEGGFTDNSRLLVFLSKIVNVLYALILDLGCRDVSNSFKLYPAEALKEVDLHLNNFDVIEEMLFKLKKNNKNLKIKEVPYTFKQRMFGQSKRNLIVFAFSYFVSLVKLKFSK